MNTSCLMKFTLNFDSNAEVNLQKPTARNSTATSFSGTTTTGN